MKCDLSGMGQCTHCAPSVVRSTWYCEFWLYIVYFRCNASTRQTVLLCFVVGLQTSKKSLPCNINEIYYSTLPDTGSVESYDNIIGFYRFFHKRLSAISMVCASILTHSNGINADWVAECDRHTAITDRLLCLEEYNVALSSWTSLLEML